MGKSFDINTKPTLAASQTPPARGACSIRPIDAQHPSPFGLPIGRVFAVGITLEVGPTDREVHVGRIRPRRIVANEVVPRRRDLADQRIVLEPLELMQLQSAGGVDVLRRQRPAAGVVEQHDARPVLLAVGGLRCAEELGGLDRPMVMLDTHHRAVVIAQRPEAGDVLAHEHVAVHEHRPPLVAAEVRCQEARERKVGRLQRVVAAPHQGAEVVQ
jgi:hypothetical protein